MFKPGREGDGMREERRAPEKEAAELHSLLFEQEGDFGYKFCGDEDDEGPFESLLRHAPEIEAGLMPGWKLDRSQAGVLLWITPSGRQYKSTLDGRSHAPYRQ